MARVQHTFLIVADLSELESDGARTQVGGGLDGVTNGILEGTVVLTSGLTVCDTNDQNWLARLAKLGQDNAVNDL